LTFYHSNEGVIGPTRVRPLVTNRMPPERFLFHANQCGRLSQLSWLLGAL